MDSKIYSEIILNFKTIFVMWNLVLDLMKIYINAVLDIEIYQDFIFKDKEFEFNRQKIISLLLEEDEKEDKHFQIEKFLCPKYIWEKTLEDLFNNLQIENICLYSFFNSINLNLKKFSKKVKIKINSKDFEFKMNYSHKLFVLMTKSKRRDEYIKLGFKFLKKLLLDQIKSENPQVKLKYLKEIFFANKLNHNKLLQKLFKKAEPTAREFLLIKNNVELYTNITDILKEKFLIEIIQSKIKSPEFKIISDEIQPNDLLKIIYNPQQRKSLSLQDIISCFEVLKSAFKF